MTETENGNGKITYKALVSIAMVVILSLISVVFGFLQHGQAKADVKIEILQKDKLDKEQYRCDMERIERKLDRVIEKATQ